MEKKSKVIIWMEAGHCDKQGDLVRLKDSASETILQKISQGNCRFAGATEHYTVSFLEDIYPEYTIVPERQILIRRQSHRISLFIPFDKYLFGHRDLTGEEVLSYLKKQKIL